MPYLRPYRGVLALALVALLVAAAAMLALPVALRYLIDEGLSSRNTETINRYFVAFLAPRGCFGVFAALRFYLVTWLGERVVADLRSAVYARVIRMDPAFFEVTRIGEVLSRLTADATLVQSIAGVNLSITLRSTLSLVGSLVMLAVTSLKLMAMLVVLIPVVIVPLIVLGRRVRTALARVAGSHRRHERRRRRDAQRDPDRAGVHAGGHQRAAFRRRRRGLLRRCRAAHADALDADGARDDAGVRRDHLRALDGRARGGARRDDGRPARPVPALRRLRGDRQRRA